MYQLRKIILPIVLPSMVEAENFSDHPLISSNNGKHPVTKTFTTLHPTYNNNHNNYYYIIIIIIIIIISINAVK